MKVKFFSENIKEDMRKIDICDRDCYLLKCVFFFFWNLDGLYFLVFIVLRYNYWDLVLFDGM